MTDSDDRLSKRYRELAREEPSASVDAAILAASRRAVASRPSSTRWAAPVSIAAVLVLAFGVTLQMQREEPGVESSVPASGDPYSTPATPTPEPPPTTTAPTATSPAAAAPAASPPTVAEPAAPPRQMAATREADRVSSPDAKVAQPKRDSSALKKEQRAAPQTMADAAAPAPPPRPFPQTVPAEAERMLAPAPAAPPSIAAPPAPAQGPATAQMAPAPAAPPPAAAQARRSEMNVQGLARAKEAAEPLPERELERIAKLRSEGRHEEADKALEAFRRAHPAYRIPEALWERVKPR